MRDYYEILGLERGADADAIKKAYRALALQYHPDRNGGATDAEEKFREATQAYEVLRDPQRRAAYDRYGHAGVQGSGAGGGFGGFDFSDALNIFMRDFGGFGLEDLFGGGRRGGGRGGTGPRAGADIRLRLPLSLQDVATGVEKTLRVKVLNPCGECQGTGAEGAAEPGACDTCGGAGEVRRVQRSMLGQLMTVTPCPACGGEGRLIRNRCSACSGEGVEAGETSLDVTVPAGVSSGDYITVRGQGSVGRRGGRRGDVYVVIEVADDPRFAREGADIYYELPITYGQAALGDRVEVPTVTGTAQVNIPRGTQSGTVIRLRDAGLPRLQSSGHGDQLVRVVVWVPTELSAEQEKLIRQLRRIETAAPESMEGAADAGGFWNRIRQAFTA
jgi:molecular chaperone DnaJ